MTSLKFATFGGIAPVLAPSKLPDNMATVASNVRFQNGCLAPWANLLDSATLTIASVRSLFSYQNNWVTSTYARQYVKSLHPGDIHERIYYTDEGYPKVRSGSAVYRLGLPRPGTPDAVIGLPGDTTSIVDVRSQSYVVTLVDRFGVEGPSSLPTISFEVGEGGTVILDLTPCAVTGNYNLGVGAFFRIYRTNSGSEGAVFQYVADVPYATGSYTDSVAPEDLQEALQSEMWVAAPDDDIALFPSGPLASMVEYPGGILAGHSGNTVYFSVPNVPTAWPYSYTIAEQIVGVAVIQGGLLVCTKGRPVLFAGSDPANMAPVPIECNEACISARSIVDMGDYVIYASSRGLVAVQGNSAELVTKDILKDFSFAAVDPATIRAFQSDGLYIMYYGLDPSATAFVFDPVTRDFSTLAGGANGSVVAAYYDVATNQAFVASKRSETTHVVAVFGKGEQNLPYSWTSKAFYTPDPCSLHCLRVQATTWPVSVLVVADGVSRGPYTISSDIPIRLPGGFRARRWQFTFSGSGVVEYAHFADAMVELD